MNPEPLRYPLAPIAIIVPLWPPRVEKRGLHFPLPCRGRMLSSNYTWKQTPLTLRLSPEAQPSSQQTHPHPCRGTRR